MGTRQTAALAAALALATALASCSGASNAQRAPRLALSSCTVQSLPARCGHLDVAENPAAPQGRQIALRVVVLPAKGGDRAADPLFYLAGGPGGAATDSTSWAAENFAPLNQRHDIVLIDQRGTGRSNRVTCPARGAPSVDEAEIAQAVTDCLTAIADQADPRYYSTPLAVDDFDLVRAALGYDKINIYGGSYGVSSGLAFIQRHGGHVRSALLDSGSLLDVRLWETAPRSSQQALQKLFDRCRADTACATAFPNLEAEFKAVIGSLAKSPVPLGVADPGTGAMQTLDLMTFLSLVVDHYLGATANSAFLPRDIHQAARGNWTPIAQIFASGQLSPELPVMALTIRCSDEWAAMDLDRVASYGQGSVFTPLTTLQASTTSIVCKYWPRAEGASGRAKTSAHVVFLNGTADPVDPPGNVAGVQLDMPNSLTVAVEGTGHGQLSTDQTGCLSDEANSFFEFGQRSSPLLWRCAQLVPMPAFAVS